MSTIMAAEIAQRLHAINQQLLKATGELDQKGLNWIPGPAVPSPAFHLWHSARWSDLLQATLPGMSPELSDRLGDGEEIWTRDRLAGQWGLEGDSLGRSETGLGMSDDDAAGLALPSKEALLDYAGQAFAAAENAAKSVSDDLLGVTGKDANGRDASIGAALLSHLTHVSRHLGMIEALRGARSGHGTASA